MPARRLFLSSYEIRLARRFRFRNTVGFLSKSDALHKERHIPGQGTHRLKALLILERFSRLCGAEKYKNRLLLTPGDTPRFTLRLKKEENPLRAASGLVADYSRAEGALPPDKPAAPGA